MKNNKLLIFNQHTSYLTIDIANVFAESGKYTEIVLLAGVVNEREDKLNEQIRHVKTIPYKKKNIFTRGISWLLSFTHLAFLLKIKFRTHRLFLVSNPPLISFVPWFSKHEYDTLIFDVYPDALVSSEFISKNNIIYRLWSKANHRFFDNANRVFTISEGMKKSIIQYCKPERIKVISLWSSFLPQLISRKENLFINAKKLNDKFIIMYSGNIGKGLGLEVILDVAKKLDGENDILFLFVGDGWALPDLTKKAKNMGLQNCRFLPYQHVSIIKHSLSAADISIVALSPLNSNISIPNKIYSLIALGRPLLCLSSKASDLSKLVVTSKIGLSFTNEQVEEMVEYILRVKNDQHFRNVLNKNAMTCATRFTKKNAMLFLD